jgi:hypothetical protein
MDLKQIFKRVEMKPWGGSKGYLSGRWILTLKNPFSNGESGGPTITASRSDIDSSFNQQETPAGGL